MRLVNPIYFRSQSSTRRLWDWLTRQISRSQSNLISNIIYCTKFKETSCGLICDVGNWCYIFFRQSDCALETELRPRVPKNIYYKEGILNEFSNHNPCQTEILKWSLIENTTFKLITWGYEVTLPYCLRLVSREISSINAACLGGMYDRILFKKSSMSKIQNRTNTPQELMFRTSPPLSYLELVLGSTLIVFDP